VKVGDVVKMKHEILVRIEVLLYDFSPSVSPYCPCRCCPALCDSEAFDTSDSVSESE
jgi:hypothetical protein